LKQEFGSDSEPEDWIYDQALMSDTVDGEVKVDIMEDTTKETSQENQIKQESARGKYSEEKTSEDKISDKNTQKMTQSPLPHRNKIRPPTWAIKAANQTTAGNPESLGDASENTDRRNIIKEMSRKKNSNSVLSRWNAPEPEKSAEDRLEGKELNSLQKYKERRKNRIENTKPTITTSTSSAIHDTDENSNPDVDTESVNIKNIMSRWQGSQVSSREPVFQRPNRIESRINDEIRLAAEKEAEYRKEKGVDVERKIKPENFDKELLDTKAKLAKIQEIENKIREIEQKELKHIQVQDNLREVF